MIFSSLDDDDDDDAWIVLYCIVLYNDNDNDNADCNATHLLYIIKKLRRQIHTYINNINI
jgi:hypothetical protein